MTQKAAVEAMIGLDAGAIHIPIFEVVIILRSRDKLHQYFGPGTIVSIVIHPNTTRNAMLLYCDPGAAINCLPVFFGPVFEVDFEGFQEIRVLKVGTSILLNCIGDKSVIIFVG